MSDDGLIIDLVRAWVGIEQADRAGSRGDREDAAAFYRAVNREVRESGLLEFAVVRAAETLADSECAECGYRFDDVLEGCDVCPKWAVFDQGSSPVVATSLVG